MFSDGKLHAANQSLRSHSKRPFLNTCVIKVQLSEGSEGMLSYQQGEKHGGRGVQRKRQEPAGPGIIITSSHHTTDSSLSLVVLGDNQSPPQSATGSTGSCLVQPQTSTGSTC